MDSGLRSLRSRPRNDGVAQFMTQYDYYTFRSGTPTPFAALSGAIVQIQYCRPVPLEPRARLLEPPAAPRSFSREQWSRL
jgi:hypothetical protein